MARLPYLNDEDLDESQRHLLERPINLHRILANSPNGLEVFSQFGEWIRWRSGLNPRLRELAILQVGYMYSSKYEFSHHIEISRNFGVTNSDIRGIASLASGQEADFSDVDLLVLSAARQLTADADLDEATWSGLRGVLGDEHAVDLVLVISFYNAVVRVLAGLKIDVEPSYAKYLDEFPLT